MPQEYLTIKQTAEILQVNPHTIYYWTYMKQIPFIKINGTKRIPRKEFDEWLEKQQHERG